LLMRMGHFGNGAIPLVSILLTTPLLHTWLWLGRVQVSHRSSIQHSNWRGDRSLTSRKW
jgi:hypothetical protein